MRSLAVGKLVQTRTLWVWPFIFVLTIAAAVAGKGGPAPPTSVAATAPARPAGPGLIEIVPGVYQFKDTCNVYAIVKDGRALLIDFGAGDILKALPAAGIQKVDWILHTHFHRDVNQGDELAKGRGIKIAVPKSERKFYENVEDFWNTKKVFDLYDMRDVFAARRQNVAVDYDLMPGEKFSWNGFEFGIFATPGHTEGSLSFKLQTGGKTLLFCGDLVASAGKIPTMHDLEWQYVGTQGLLAEMHSINNVVRDMAPDILLPAHGSPSQDIEEWTPALLAQLARVYSEYDWINFSQWRPAPGPVRLAPHVWQMRRAFAYGVGYLIVADDGHAMLWDCNAGEVDFLEDMKKIAGYKSIDVIVPSHYHDDHVGGLNAVKTKYGAQLWTMDHMVDVIEHPMAYNLPCLWPKGAKVDRVLHDGEKVDFHGIPLQFFYLPGQTEYTEGLLLTDGKRVLFDGDNVAHPLPGFPLEGHFVCRNYQKMGGGHVYAARKILELKPDIIAPNHFEWNAATPAIMQSYLRTSEAVQDAWEAIIDQPDPEIGVDNEWASFYPYQSEAGPGAEIAYELRIRNWIARASHIRAVIMAPEGWTVTPRTMELDVAPKSSAVGKFRVTIPASEGRLNRRFVLTADLWRDGEHLGEVTEGLVNISPMKAH